MTPVSTQSLIAQARRLVGVPYAHQGRSVHGIDCIGFIAISATSAGVDLVKLTGLEDRRDYGRKPTSHLLSLVARSCTRVRVTEPGLMILFRFPNERAPQHLAILTDTNTIVHADAKRGCVVEHGYRGQWLRWTHSLWHIPGVMYGA
jgi:cell wall-associated NlpC family hydrolase